MFNLANLIVKKIRMFMSNVELYNEFKRTNNEKAKQYDLICFSNANLYLHKKADGKVDVNWPTNFGYAIDSIKPLEELGEKELLCSRIEFDEMSISTELYMGKKTEEFSEDDMEWYELVKHAMHGEDTKTHFNIINRRFNKIKDQLIYKTCNVGANSFGNCFGYQLKKDLCNRKQFNKYNVVVDEGIIDIILKYQPYLINLKNYIKYNGMWDSNEERAIPKSMESSCLHLGYFNLSNYKKMIDILDSDIPAITKRKEMYKLDILCGQFSDIIQEKYNKFKEKKNYINGIVTKYGYYGCATRFGDLCGGAKQINTIFDYEELVNYGIIEDAELFYRRENIFVSHRVEYFSKSTKCR